MIRAGFPYGPEIFDDVILSGPHTLFWAESLPRKFFLAEWKSWENIPMEFYFFSVKFLEFVLTCHMFYFLYDSDKCCGCTDCDDKGRSPTLAYEQRAQTIFVRLRVRDFLPDLFSHSLPPSARTRTKHRIITKSITRRLGEYQKVCHICRKTQTFWWKSRQREKKELHILAIIPWETSSETGFRVRKRATNIFSRLDIKSLSR